MNLQKKKIFSFFNYESRNFSRAALVLVVSTILAKILALIRDRILAGLYGASRNLDIYYTAFRIPDFLTNILILGAISAALIPVFADLWQKDKKKAWQLCNNLLCIFLFILLILVIFAFIFAPQIIKIIAPGFNEHDLNLTVGLTRIMFLSPIFLVVSSVFSSVLQYFSRFLVYSLAPFLYNLGIIIGAVFFTKLWGLYGLAVGVVLGALMHLLIQIPTAYLCGWRPQFIFNLKDKATKTVIKLTIPRTIGFSAQQINLIVITAIASTFPSGSIAIFNLANNLQAIPVSLFGISFATAVFPDLSRHVSLRNKEKFISSLKSSFSQILFLVFPISLLFFVFRAQIVRLILGSGVFGWVDTRLTAAVLGIFSFSIFAQSLVPLFSRAFHSLKDTKTPMIISILTVIFNIILLFLFSWLFQFDWFGNFFIDFLKLKGINNVSVLSIPLAFLVSSVFNLILLEFALEKKIPNKWPQEIAKSFWRIFLVSIFCSLIGYFALNLFGLILNTRTFLGLFIQTALAGFVAILFYLGIAYFLNFPEFKEIKKGIFIN